MASLCFVLPGFGGSGLRAEGGLAAILGPYWFEPSRLLVAGPRVLTLADDGQSPLLLNPTLRSKGQSAGYYGPIMGVAEQVGYVVVWCDYDWRLRLETAANHVAELIDQTVAQWPLHTPGDPITRIAVLAHSQGGLVARLAYPLVGGAARALWTRTVYLGVPHGGTHQSGASLDLQGKWFAMLLCGALARYSVAWWEILTLGTLKTMVRSWPAVYEMLPTFAAGPWGDLDPGAALLYMASNYQDGGPIIDKWAAEARDTQAKLQGLLSQPRPGEINVIGTGLDTMNTVTSAVVPPNFQRRLVFQTTKDGDGVVNRQRAALPGAREVLLNGVEHLAMIQSSEVLVNLPTWLSPPFNPVDPPVNVPAVVKQVLLPAPILPADQPKAVFFPGVMIDAAPPVRRSDP